MTTRAQKLEKDEISKENQASLTFHERQKALENTKEKIAKQKNNQQTSSG